MHVTWDKTDLHRHKINTSYGCRCLKYRGIKMWNSLPNSFKCTKSITHFKQLVKNYLLTTAFWLIWLHVHFVYDTLLSSCLLTSFNFDFRFYAYMTFYVAVTVWFRPSCISYISDIFFYWRPSQWRPSQNRFLALVLPNFNWSAYNFAYTYCYTEYTREPS